MVAAETPLKMIDKARGTDASGTRRIARAADIVQNPPSAAPSRTRPQQQHGEVESESRDEVGYQQKDREAEHQDPSVKVSDDRRDEEAR